MTAVMERDICCRNFKGLLTYLKNHYGKEGVQKVLEGLTDNPAFLIRDKMNPGLAHPVQERHLTDPGCWVSNEFSLALFKNVHKVVPRPDALLEIGMGAVREDLSGRLLFMARILGPLRTARRAAALNAHFNRTKDVSLSEEGEGSLSFTLKYRAGFRVTKDVCHWNLGIYTEIAQLTGARDVRAREERCVLEGDDHCVIRITWRPAPLLVRLTEGLARGFMRWLAWDLIEEYETTVRERDELIDRLARSEQRYRTLFEDSSEAMSLTAAGRVTDVNPAWLALHGCSRKEEVLGREVADFVHPDYHLLLKERRKSWPALKERTCRMRDLRCDGSLVDVEIRSFPIVVEGESLLLATVRDVTELIKAEEARRQLEARVKRAEKMEALGTLAGGVAHDLNNILSGIVGYPDLLLLQIPPEEHSLREAVKAIKESGLKAAAVVQDLLTLARRGVAPSEVINLNRIIEDYLKSPEFRRLMDMNPHVKVEAKLCPDLANIEGSYVHLTKTVMNLVSNAAEAMPEGGTITLRTENVRVERPITGYDRIREGIYAVMTVSDTGVGIAPEDQEKIFEPFYTKKVMGRSGTGLGMSVVWGSVKDHNGYINVESRLGKGTSFTIFLPAVGRQPLGETQRPDLAELRGNGERILVVDDTRQQREIAARILSELGYEAVVASSGEEALEAARKGRFALILLDMIMAPDMDGLETYCKISEICPGQKAIIVSGYSETDRVRQAQRLGAAIFVKKPYTVETLALAVRRALDTPSSQPLSEAAPDRGESD